MPIQGLTDQATRQARQDTKKKPALEIAKGHRQVETRTKKNGKDEITRSMGRDLEDKLRLTVNYAPFAHILKAHYGTPDKNGDFIVEQVKVYVPYDDIDRACPTTMVAYGKSGFKLACDHAVIYKKIKEEKTEQGVFRQLVDVQEPCPMRGKPLALKCPYKCGRQAKLHLYVKEVFDTGYLTMAIVDFGGFEDLGDAGILSQLQDWQSELGSLTTSPFYWEIDRGDGTSINCDRIPFILSRRKVTQKKPMMEGDRYNPVRTGNNFLGFTWILDIQPDPDWLQKYRTWQHKQKIALEIKQSGFKMRPSAIAGLLHSSTPFNPNDVVLEAEVISDIQEQNNSEFGVRNSELNRPNIIPNSELTIPNSREPELTEKPWMPIEKNKDPVPLTSVQRDVLKAEFERNNWQGKAVVLMIQDRFGASHGSELFDFHYAEVYAIASDPKQAKYWNDLAEF